MITRLNRVLDGPGRALLRRLLGGLLVCAVLQGVGFVLLVPLLRALLGPDPTATWPWIGALAAVFAVYAACYWTSIMTGYRLGATLSRALHHRLGDHVATLPLGWFTGARSGELAHVTGKGVVDVMGAPAHLLRPLVTALVTPLVVVAGMALFDWRLALAALAGVPLAALAFRATAASVTRNERRADAASAEAGDRVIEFARLQPVLRAFRRTTEGHRTLDDALVEHRQAGRSLLLGAVPAFLGVVVAVQLAFTIVLLAGTYLVLGGTVGAAELIALLVLAVRFAEPLIAAADIGAALRMARGALDRMTDVLDEPALAEPATSGVPSDADVELVDVRFGYRDGEPVLDGVSLTAAPRGVTALVGASGTGKTTMLRLIARFHDVDTGTVRIGGVDVRDMTTADLMSRVSLVFQDVYLFDATIAENVRLARPDADDDALAEVARLARLDEVLDRLPDGWETRVGEGGTALSGGERQRVSIARALLKDAPIVLLDEATAALDPENEAAVQGALSALSRDRTVVVVAHRLQTVVAADRIAVLEPAPDGSRVAELGTHDELLALGGRYTAFWAERTRARGWRLDTSPSDDPLEVDA